MHNSWSLMLAAALVCACPSDSKDEDSATAPNTDPATATGTTPGVVTDPTTAPSDTGEQCNSFDATTEGCQIGGPSPGVCPAAPKGWSGTAAPGAACTIGTDCAGIVCKCSDPVVEWYVGVCACDTCADYATACEVANFVDCKQITPG